MIKYTNILSSIFNKDHKKHGHALTVTCKSRGVPNFIHFWIIPIDTTTDPLPTLLETLQRTIAIRYMCYFELSNTNFG